MNWLRERWRASKPPGGVVLRTTPRQLIGVTVRLPKLSVEGIETHYTGGLVIDHATRTIRGTAYEMPDGPLLKLFRSLRSGDLVNLKFWTYQLDEPDFTEFQGKGELLMARIRPSRNHAFGVRFMFRLWE